LDIELASFQIGQPIETNHVTEIQSRLETLSDGKLWITKFIGFQYPGLSENCKPHMPVFQCLAKHNIPVHKVKVIESYSEGNEKVFNTLPKGNGSLQEKEKETDKDKEEEIRERGLGKTYSSTSRSVLTYLREQTGRPFREVDSNLSVIQARLDEPGVDFEGIKKMIDRQILRWKGTNFEEYYRPTTLFGKEKFDGYYAAKDQPINGETHRGNPPQRVDRSIGTANEGTAHLYKGLGRVKQ